jgi:FKBP-type peptidyl-prolyl cis-trans isomerase SlyD
MQVKPNTVVSLSYQLRTEPNGQVMDEATTNEPFEFLFGHSNVLEKFEANLQNLVAGNQFHFTVDAVDGYGEFDPEALLTLQKEDFVFDGEDASHMIEVGNIIPLQDQQGNAHQGRITAIGDTEVTIDMNHPFAGKTLHFSGEVIGVREAHPTEIAHGHIHAQGNHDHH